MVEYFKGWEANVDWGDLSFYADHGDKITKIAIVADPKHETDLADVHGRRDSACAAEVFPAEQD